MSSQNGQSNTFPPIAVSIADAAKMIGLGRTSFYKLLAAGEISSVRCGGRVLIPIAQLNALIERLQQPGEAKDSQRSRLSNR